MKVITTEEDAFHVYEDKVVENYKKDYKFKYRNEWPYLVMRKDFAN